jgi:hypothetical protein
MKSVRLGEALEDRLERAASLAGMSESEIIREAVAKECDEILGTSLYEQIKPFIGVVASDAGGDARRAGEIFGDLVEQDFERQKADRGLRRSS